MKIGIKNGDGIVIQYVNELPEKYIKWSDELQIKYDSFVKAVINEDFTDIIEGVTEEEIIEYNNQKIKELNKMQFEELSRTDWYYTKQIELGNEVPIEIIEERKAIREKYNKLKQL